MMKKWISVIMCMVLVMLSAACAGQTGAEGSTGETEEKKDAEQETLVVCVEDSRLISESLIKREMYNYFTLECNRIKFEPLPSEGAEREAACDRIRIELMSGGGPDVFILGSGNVFGDLFTHIEKTMRGGYFLPLDEYIENWDTDLFEKQEKIIMDAGKTEEGQVVLPLLYTLPVFVVGQNETIDNEGPFTTWEDLNAAAEKDATILQTLNEQRWLWFPARFTTLGDYDIEKITLEQEKLQMLLQQVKDLDAQESLLDKYLYGAMPGEIIEIGAEETQQIQLSSGIQIRDGMEELFYNDDRSAFAVYNTEGGLTAMITAYALVNRNTRHAEDSAKIASVFYNDKYQDANRYIAVPFLFNGISSVPTSEAYTYYELLQPYLEQVNAVRFYSEYDEMLSYMSFSVKRKDPAEVAEDELSKMKMMMAE